MEPIWGLVLLTFGTGALAASVIAWVYENSGSSGEAIYCHACGFANKPGNTYCDACRKALNP